MSEAGHKNRRKVFSSVSVRCLHPQLISPLSLSSTASGRQRIQNHKLPARVGWGKSLSLYQPPHAHHPSLSAVIPFWNEVNLLKRMWRFIPGDKIPSRTVIFPLRSQSHFLFLSASKVNPSCFLSPSLLFSSGKEEQCFQRMLLWEPETLQTDAAVPGLWLHLQNGRTQRHWHKVLIKNILVELQIINNVKPISYCTLYSRFS